MKKISPFILCLIFLACEEILTVPNIENETVELLSPSSNAIIKSPSVRFSWLSIENTERYLLQVFVVDEESSSNIIIDTLVTGLQFTDTLTINGNYTWRVRGENSGYKTSFSTNTFQIVLPGIQEENAGLLSPAENAQHNSSNLFFAWENIDEAENYRLQIATPDFSDTSKFLLDSITQTTSVNYKLTSLGNYQWRIRGENVTGNSKYSSRSFTLIDPLLKNEITLLSPINGTTIEHTQTALNWENLSNTNSYRLQIVTPNFTSPTQFIMDSLVNSNQITVDLLDNTYYQWRVKGIGDFSETPYTTWTFNTATSPSINDETLTLTAPTNNTVLTDVNVNFNWNAVTAAENYHIQVATPNFTNPQQLLLDEVLTESQTTIELPDHSQFQWRVRAINSISETAYAIQNFSIASVPSIEDITISLLAPINNSVLSGTMVNLSWDQIEDAENYRIQIATPNLTNPQQLLLDEVLTESQTTIELPDHTQFQWRVKGINGISETAYTIRNFSIASINSIANQTISILAPVNNSSLPSTTVNLNWGALDDVEHYHVQIATPSFANATQIVFDQEVTNTMATASLQASTTYEWRVKGVNAISSTNYTSVKFSTQ